MSASAALFRLLVFPGALFAVPMSWLMVWLHRKVNARLQGRVGPPFYQPYYDFVKLLAKQPVSRPTLQRVVMYGLPLLAVASTLGALALLPVIPGSSGFTGDLVLLVALLEFAPLCSVLAGYASRSLYGQIGSTREAVLGVVYSLPFMIALFALSSAAGTFSVAGVATVPSWMVKAPALAALALCLPAKLRLNPFSVPNAEQEIYAGSLTEFDGPSLALWELAHDLEWVALVGLWVAIALPLPGAPVIVQAVVFVLVLLAIVPALSLVASGTARLKLSQAARVFWQWGLGISTITLVIAAVWQ